MSAKIHKTAVISPKAEVDESAEIGPFCIIGDGVIISKGCKLHSHIVIEGKTVLGKNCTVFPFASIGLAPQDLKYKNEKTGVKIGNNNVIREYATVHRGSVSGNGITEVGDSNFLMAYSHLAHDCRIGNNNILANAATLAGHVTVEDFAFIGGLVAVHQNTRIGSYAMVGGFSGIGQDIPPFTMASGPRAKLYGLNVIGLKRHGFSDETINKLKKVYKILFREKRTLQDALKTIRRDYQDCKEVMHLVEFIEENKRGICR
ncbi:MAG: acyl-ACP--UDP-N-acetylglucosamine O-acyltransferase [Dissulfurispiraceae bacterium]|jgi:UDP-N-acetylglucosamine acyltransferase|nr:acyl-ACP--UDP-N-acetylglucosamine O-acyltransferase [Dissulfurispiraceae bacterium]